MLYKEMLLDEYKKRLGRGGKSITLERFQGADGRVRRDVFAAVAERIKSLSEETKKLVSLEKEFLRVKEKESLRKKIEAKFGEKAWGSSFTLEEVAEIFGISRERVRQIEEISMKKLLTPGTAQKLKEYKELTLATA